MMTALKLPAIDIDAEVNRLTVFIKDQVFNQYKRQGAVIGLSGGIDSAVTALLTREAVGTENIVGLIMKEKESNPQSAIFAAELANKFNIELQTVDITTILEAFGVYETRNEVVGKYFPEFDGSQRWGLAQPGNLLESNALNFYSLCMETAGGVAKKRIRPDDLRIIIGATNIKQRTRMTELYKVAEMRHYLVAGTTNLSETALGFYVKYGDGGVDIEPLAHLYKTYVFQIGRKLGVPQSILNRAPSPDTFSFTVSDEEFFFRLSYDALDYILWAQMNNIPPQQIASEVGIDEKKTVAILRDLQRKREVSRHLRELPASIIA